MQIIFTDGLGNQMFQYALYLSLRHRGRNPKINTGIINRNIVHNGFELYNVFNIERSDLPIAWSGNFAGGVTIFIDRHLRCLCYHQDVEHFSDKVFHTRKPFIIGFWQDIRYFAEVESEIRKSFTFRNIDIKNQEIGKEMLSCNSASLHIRRGDYLKCQNYQVCTPEYYRKAITALRERVNNLILYVFSDDLQWSEDFVKSLDVEYRMVDNNRGKDSYKDMYLMTCCHHNIIANSSFSWWGAWLGNTNGKIVVCPDIWLWNHTLNPCPKNWLRINNQI